jgi:hypothetical protein
MAVSRPSSIQTIRHIANPKKKYPLMTIGSVPDAEPSKASGVERCRAINASDVIANAIHFDLRIWVRPWLK